MASNHRAFTFILFLVSLHVHLPFISSSSSSDSRSDFEGWVSWNMMKHRSRKAMESVNGREGQMDEKLRRAEMNRASISVSQDGNGDFTTIKAALNSIPPRNKRRVILIIKPGVYREKILVPKTLPFVTFLGDAVDPPTITGNDTASVISDDTGKPLKTYSSSTVAVDSDYFVATNIIFENRATHEVGRKGEQGVALRVSGTKAAFYNCSFLGSQDTLYDHKGLHYFNQCFIQGSVDFIFGYGTSLYDGCHLNSVAKKVASLTAQKRSISSMASGFSFKDCLVTGSGMVYLGRAWGDYSRVVFSYTFMDSLVVPQGWSDWGDHRRDERVYYGEYKCKGPGANMTGRVPWARVLTDEEAIPFLGTYFVDGDTWLIN